MSAPTERRGFTLVELMVSLLLLTLVLTLVYGAFGQISGFAVRIRDELTEQQELRLVARMIADDLQAAQWLKAAAEKSEPIRSGIVARPRQVATRTFTDISFHAARPARFHREVSPLADPGLHELGYLVEENPDRTAFLLVRREDFYLDDDLEAGGIVVVVAEGLERFDVEFLPADATGSAAQERWEERWDSPNRTDASRMPVAIRLSLARKDATGRVLSETVEFNLHSMVKL